MSLELEHIVFSYPGSDFLLNCQRFELGPGQVVSIEGPNGSGKTTLTKLMCGILVPHEGCIKIDGRSMSGRPLSEFGSHVGYLFQDPARQLFATSVFQELTFIQDLMGMSSKATHDKAQELLHRFGLERLSDRSPYRLSQGEKQRLAFCAILMQDPAYLVLDEPSSGLDEENRNLLSRYVHELASEGKGIAIVSHDPAFSASADTHLRVEEGAVL